MLFHSLLDQDWTEELGVDIEYLLTSRQLLIQSTLRPRIGRSTLRKFGASHVPLRVNYTVVCLASECVRVFSHCFFSTSCHAPLWPPWRG